MAAAQSRPEAVTLTVRDAQGCLLATAPGTTGQPTALLAGLPAGVYLLEAALPDGRRTMQRVAVQQARGGLNHS